MAAGTLLLGIAHGVARLERDDDRVGTADRLVVPVMGKFCFGIAPTITDGSRPAVDRQVWTAVADQRTAQIGPVDVQLGEGNWLMGEVGRDDLRRGAAERRSLQPRRLPHLRRPRGRHRVRPGGCTRVRRAVGRGGGCPADLARTATRQVRSERVDASDTAMQQDQRFFGPWISSYIFRPFTEAYPV
jgi:hypothetical protein